MLRLFRVAPGRHWVCAVPLKSGPISVSPTTMAAAEMEPDLELAPELHAEAASSAAAETSAQAEPEPGAMDLQPVVAASASMAVVDGNAWKTMRFAWLDSVRSKPSILSGIELADRVNELLANDASVYLASPAVPSLDA